MFDALAPDDVLPCAVTMVRLFAARGNREHRGRARLRHVRERLGDDQFAAMVREAVDAARTGERWPPADLPQAAAAARIAWWRAAGWGAMRGWPRRLAARCRRRKSWRGLSGPGENAPCCELRLRGRRRHEPGAQVPGSQLHAAALRKPFARS